MVICSRRCSCTCLSRWEVLEEEEVLLLHLAVPLQPGELRLSLAYTGLLDDSMRGFYRTKHTEVCD